MTIPKRIQVGGRQKQRRKSALDFFHQQTDGIKNFHVFPFMIIDDESSQQLPVILRGKVHSLHPQLIRYLRIIHDIAIAGDGIDGTAQGFNHIRLGIFNDGVPTGRITNMADGCHASQGIQLLLRKRFLHIAHRFTDLKFITIGGCNATTLLTPMLLRIQH